MMESSRKLCVHLEQAGPGKQLHDFCSALCLVCVCSVGERLVGGVHLPAGSRAANGQQQLLRYGEWVLHPAAARVPSWCWTALLAAWESLGWIPLLLLLPLLSMTSCYVKILSGAHVLDPPVPMGALPAT